MNYLRASSLSIRAACVGLAIVSTSAAVAGITPSYDVFGKLAGATYGGTGIPTEPTAITTIGPAITGGDTITLGLIAHQRFSNPVLKDDDKGTYTATTGFNDGLAGPGHDLGPTWNFGLYLNITGVTSVPNTYTMVLRFMNNHNSDLADQLAFQFQKGTFQDSWNLSMGFLDSIDFDPNAAGEYGIALDAYTINGDPLGSSAIVVKVENPNAVPDSTSTSVLFGVALLGLVAFRQSLVQEPLLARSRTSA